MSTQDEALREIAALLGAEGWLTSPDAKAPYEREWRGHWTGNALGVAKPRDTSEVAGVIEIAAGAGVSIVPHGGNTGLVAGGVPRNGIVISTERMTAVRAVDEANMTITVEAGCILANVQATADEHGLYFPLSLGAEGSCRIGGNISTNAGGVAVLRYGNTRELVMGLEVVLPDGLVWDGLRSLRKDNTGYDLKQLFIGAEGTLGIVTAAVLKLFPKPIERVTAIVGVSDWHASLKLFQRLRRGCGDHLTAYESMSHEAVGMAIDLIDGVRHPLQETRQHYVLVELTSPRHNSGLTAMLETEIAGAIEDAVAADAVVAMSDAQSTAFWRMREAIPEAQVKAGASIKNDVSIPVSQIPAFIDKASLAVKSIVSDATIVAFGHLGDGNIHFNVSQPKGMDADAFLTHWPALTQAVSDAAVSFGGSFSAEHGIGEIKRDALSRYRSGIEIDLMRALKQALDPHSIMNPGKVIPD